MNDVSGISPTATGSTVSHEQIIRQAAQAVCEANDGRSHYHTAVILGSGLGYAGDTAVAEGGVDLPFEEIPGMPLPAVDGHAGRLICGRGMLEGVLLLQGRVHCYEGHPLKDVTFAVRLLHQLGVERVVISNAAGGIHPAFDVGDLMLIEGHLSLLDLVQRRQRQIQVTGQRDQRLWNAELITSAMSVSTPLKIHRGVYAMTSGPNYETKAEIRMLQKLGADAVGMSTIPEALVAQRLGMATLGVSCITNKAAGLGAETLHHDEVSHAAGQIEEQFCAWLFDLLKVICQCRSC
jgi:purine-nucleoside phosphorylase